MAKRMNSAPPVQEMAIVPQQSAMGLVKRDPQLPSMPAMMGNQQNELATNQQMSAEVAEIQSMMIFAMHNPRNMTRVQERIDHAASNAMFADAAIYSFPRGGKFIPNPNGGKDIWEPNLIEGPSVVMARELAKLMGNLRYGYEIIREAPTSRIIQGWAMDLETNTKVTAQDMVEKVIERKSAKKDKLGNITEDVIGTRLNEAGESLFLIRPSERDLRELQNRRAAFLVRNLILQLIPDYVVKDVIIKCNTTLEADSKTQEARSKAVAAFLPYGIDQAHLEGYMGKVVDKFDATDVAKLRKTIRGIMDGNTDPKEILNYTKAPEQPAVADGKPAVPEKKEKERVKVTAKGKVSDTPNRGHDDSNIGSVAKKNDAKPAEKPAEPEATEGQGSLLPDAKPPEGGAAWD